MQLILIHKKELDGISSTLLSPYTLIGYANNNFAGDLKNCKSVMEYCFFLNRAIVL